MISSKSLDEFLYLLNELSSVDFFFLHKDDEPGKPTKHQHYYYTLAATFNVPLTPERLEATVPGCLTVVISCSHPYGGGSHYGFPRS